MTATCRPDPPAGGCGIESPHTSEPQTEDCRLPTKKRRPAWLTGPLMQVYEVQINGCDVKLCLS
jgi:hypothetical protein